MLMIKHAAEEGKGCLIDDYPEIFGRHVRNFNQFGKVERTMFTVQHLRLGR